MTPFPSGEQVEIAWGDQRVVAVEVGGGLRSYAVSGRELLDGYGAEERCTAGRGQLLVPWPNRLRDGRYEFDGRSHQTPLTEPPNGNAIHGLVRWRPWKIERVEAHRAVLEHVLDPQPGYPFALGLAVEYALSGDGLLVRTTATNLGTEACPYGAGAHPYLVAASSPVDAVVLRVPARTVLRTDGRGIPVGSEPVAGTVFDFRQPRPVGPTVLDHAFTDLERDDDGRARVTLLDPRERTLLTLWVDEAHPYLMLFTGDAVPDVNRRSLAVEPMTCPPNAFGSGEGVVRLEPGGSFTSEWGIVFSREHDARN